MPNKTYEKRGLSDAALECETNRRLAEHAVTPDKTTATTEAKYATRTNEIVCM